jgi:hypothetical protein
MAIVRCHPTTSKTRFVGGGSMCSGQHTPITKCHKIERKWGVLEVIPRTRKFDKSEMNYWTKSDSIGKTMTSTTGRKTAGTSSMKDWSSLNERMAIATPSFTRKTYVLVLGLALSGEIIKMRPDRKELLDELEFACNTAHSSTSTKRSRPWIISCFAKVTCLTLFFSAFNLGRIRKRLPAVWVSKRNQ